MRDLTAAENHQEGVGYLRLDNHKHVSHLMSLFFNANKRVKEFVKTKTKPEHIAFLQRILDIKEKALAELHSGENAK